MKRLIGNWELGIGNFFLSFLLFLLPLQTQWILREGVLDGQHWEYGTIGIFLTDLVLAVVLILRWSHWRSFARAFRQTPASLFGLIVVAFAIQSIPLAIDRSVAILHILWLVEAMLIAALVASDSRPSWLIGSFVSGSVLQAVIGIGQFIVQSTASSTLLGWSAHPAYQPGSSVIELAGERWLRSYAGLPHPNIFGGWMAIAILTILFVLLAEPRLRMRGMLAASLVLCSAGLAVSFSRSAEIAVVIGIIVLISSDGRHRHLIMRTALVVAVSAAVMIAPYRSLMATRIEASARLEEQSISERSEQYSQAWELIRRQEFKRRSGVAGIGNYTAVVFRNHPERPVWDIQPVHNAFVLMAAEVHWTALVFVLAAAYYLLKRIFGIPPLGSLRRHVQVLFHPAHPSALSLFLALIILLILDHYLWSLHGGLLLVGVTMGGLIQLSSAGQKPSSGAS